MTCRRGQRPQFQARFLRFQQQRKREKKLQRGLVNAGAGSRERDTEQLRERFIAACLFGWEYYLKIKSKNRLKLNI